MIDAQLVVKLKVDFGVFDSWKCIKHTQIPEINYENGQSLSFRCNDDSKDNLIGDDLDLFIISSVFLTQRKDDSWIYLIDFEFVTVSEIEIQDLIEEFKKAGWLVERY